MAINDDFNQQNLIDQKRQLELARRKAIIEKRKAMMLKQQAKSESPALSVNQGTTNFLRRAWLTLIPSYGLTLLWINIHTFLNKIFGDKLFCKLGYEWVPKSAPNKKELSQRIAVIEIIVFIILDLLLLFVIFAFITFLGIIAYVWTNPSDVLKILGSELWDFLKKLIGGT